MKIKSIAIVFAILAAALYAINIPISKILLEEVEPDVHRLVKAQIGPGGYMGYCYRYWSTKKTILKEKYGIKWRAPGEMNPMVHFD